MPTEPLTDAETAELRRILREGYTLTGSPFTAAVRNALPRLLDELQERRAQASAHVSVMDVAHDYATVLRDWNARARAVLEELPPVGLGDQVTIPRELYERLLALKWKKAATP